MTVQEKVLAVINRCDVGMLGNNDSQGNPQIKAMLKTKNENLNVFWFCSNTSSKRAAQIKNDGNACLYFFEGGEGVMMRGRAELSYDDKIRESFWQDFMYKYYPLGFRDPSLNFSPCKWE